MNIAHHYLQLEHLLGRWQAQRFVLDRYHSFQAYYRGEMIISEATIDLSFLPFGVYIIEKNNIRFKLFKK